MHNESTDAAKALSWDYVMDQLRLIDQVDRNLPIAALAGWLHFCLDAGQRHALLDSEVQTQIRCFADLLGGISNLEGFAQTTARTALQDAWSDRTQANNS